MTRSTSSISVLGAGSFGTAVAASLARSGQRVTLYCRTAEQSQAIAKSGVNNRYFPGHRLPDGILPCASLETALAADVIFLAFPARSMDDYVASLAASEPSGRLVVNLVKGLHSAFFSFANLFRERAPTVRYVTLKGPTFARPLFLGEWSGLTIGGDRADAAALRELFSGTPIAFDYFPSAEAVDLVSALKNIYAIVLGLVGSTGPSENTSFGVVTLVLREMAALLSALGYGQEVLLRFAGVGDTLLTGLCDTSRNRTLGLMMGKGIPIDIGRSNFLAEGARAVEVMAQHMNGLEAPLFSAARAVLNGAAPVSMMEALYRIREDALDL